MTQQTASSSLTLELHGLRPAPQERWRALRAFSGPTEAELEAMRATVEVLFHYLQRVVRRFPHDRRI